MPPTLPLAPAPLGPHTIRLVRESFAAVAPMATQAAAMFYDRVFERAPAAAGLFHGDMARQGERLMAMIGMALAALDDLPALDRVLADLGRRHQGYGVQPAHYAVVGGALLDTLASALGEDFRPEHRAAWASLYGHMQAVMLGATTAAPTALAA